MNPLTKNILSFILRIGVSVALLLWLFSKINMKQTLETLKAANPVILVYAFLLFVLLNVAIFWRWVVFIRALGLNARLADIFKFFMFGLFGNLFLPSAVGGDIIKIIGLCKDSSQKPRVVASVLLDRLSGFAAVALVAVVSFALGYKYINDMSMMIAIALVACGLVCVALVLFNERVYSFFCGVFNSWPKVKNALMSLHYDVMLMKDKKLEGIKGIAISCFTQSGLAICWFVIAKALGQDVQLIYFLIFTPLTCVAAAVPSIGGLGVREAGAAYLFAKAGMDSGVSVSISLILYVFMIIAGLMGGTYYVLTLYFGWLQRNSLLKQQRASGY